MSLRKRFEYKLAEKKIKSSVPISCCPICGSYPILKEEDMGHDNGHGYPGHTAYTLSCDYCEIFPSVTTDDLRFDEDRAMPELVAEWNDNVVFVEELIKNKDKQR